MCTDPPPSRLARFVHRWLQSRKLGAFVLQSAKDGTVVDTIEIRDEDGDVIDPAFTSEQVTADLEQAASDYAQSVGPGDAHQPARFTLFASSTHRRQVLGSCPFTMMTEMLAPGGLGGGLTPTAFAGAAGVMRHAEAGSYFDQELQEPVNTGVTHQLMRHLEGVMRIQVKSMDSTIGHLSHTCDRMMARQERSDERMDAAHVRYLEATEKMLSQQQERELNLRAFEANEKREDAKIDKLEQGFLKLADIVGQIVMAREQRRAVPAGPPHPGGPQASHAHAGPGQGTDPFHHPFGPFAAGATGGGAPASARAPGTAASPDNNNDDSETEGPAIAETVGTTTIALGDLLVTHQGLIGKLQQLLGADHVALREVMEAMHHETVGEAVPPTMANAVLKLHGALDPRTMLAAMSVLTEDERRGLFTVFETAQREAATATRSTHTTPPTAASAAPPA